MDWISDEHVGQQRDVLQVDSLPSEPPQKDPTICNAAWARTFVAVTIAQCLCVCTLAKSFKSPLGRQTLDDLWKRLILKTLSPSQYTAAHISVVFLSSNSYLSIVLSMFAQFDGQPKFWAEVILRWKDLMPVVFCFQEFSPHFQILCQPWAVFFNASGW